MSFKLPKLPYAKDALEPYVSAETLEYHHEKHHQGYVNKINNLIKGTEFESATLEEIIKKADGGIFNNGAQVWNHTFYFEQFSPKGRREPLGVLKEAIEKEFNDFAHFKQEFSNAASTLFGSGWAWLVVTPDNELQIVKCSNAENPLRDGMKPLLTCDVWEHAYYLDKQNARPSYINDFWKIIDWQVIAKRYEQK